ncbi:MAG: DUF1203 domain-containing protein [Acidobacteria bacterium]|nr:DUF1203 domain-containing protein [Acidobacteriota bacterium]
MKTQFNFQIRPLSPEVAEAARQTRVDRFGNSLEVVRDGNPHQCRVCLTLSQPEEGVILLAHRPFESNQPYAETGPIFVHERTCQPYDDDSVYPADFPRSAVVLRGYSSDDRILDAQAVGQRIVEDVISEMFANPAIQYLHARNLGYGCFMFQIDRSGLAEL